MKTSKTFLAATLLTFFAACTDSTVSGPGITAVNEPLVSAQGNAGLTLHPSGFGEQSLAAWRAQEGIQDSRGNGDHALYFQKFTATETFAAGVARIHGLEGEPLSAITGLSWERRVDGWCGAGAPRWDVIVADESGDRGVIFLGCAAALKSPGTEGGWIRDSYPGPGVLVGQPIFGFTTDFDPTDDLKISQLAIVFDEGTTQFGLPLGPGFVYLDNITVNGKVFTSPADNGGN